MDGQGDNTDARGLFDRFKAVSITPEVTLTGSVDQEEYHMGFPKRGKCLIFNHKLFEPQTKLNRRNGTDEDAVRLYARFKELGFDVRPYTDLTVKEVLNQLKRTGKEDHSEYSCFVCCILSHGDLGILYGKDGKYPSEEVFAPFRGDVCPSLVGKPKMFFIQACQGDQLDGGVSVITSEDVDSSQCFKIPTHADFLIMCSTVPGFYSWRNTTYGSWFIQALCKVLERHSKDKDLMEILTIVSRRVAYDFESYTPDEPCMHLKKQVPCITSTLTRKIKFP